MAKELADIFGTEKDPTNCPFYYKIGACRHGDRCSRIHVKPVESQTLLLKGLWRNPAAKLQLLDGESLDTDDKALQAQFEEFYEDICLELQNFGTLEEMHVVDNLGDHMIGNVYAKFAESEQAQKAGEALMGRYYAGLPIMVELCPVTNFREARCRQVVCVGSGGAGVFDVGECTRSNFCNFLHLKPVSAALHRKLFPNDRRSRSRSPPRGGRGRGGGEHDDRPRYRDGGRDGPPRRRSPPRYDDRDRGPAYPRSRSRSPPPRDVPGSSGSASRYVDRGYDRQSGRHSPPRRYSPPREPYSASARGRGYEDPTDRRPPPPPPRRRSPPRDARDQGYVSGPRGPDRGRDGYDRPPPPQRSPPKNGDAPRSR